MSNNNHLLGGAGYPATFSEQHPRAGLRHPHARGPPSGSQTTGNGRSDWILLMRIGDDANSRMSIAHDTVVDIPAPPSARQRGLPIGGTALAMQRIEEYTGIDINHVMIVSFEDFRR